MAFRPIALGELGERLGREVDGERAFVIRGAASLDRAGPEDLVFVRSAAWADKLAASGAGAVIAAPDVDTRGLPTLRSPRPELDWAYALREIAVRERTPAGVHPSAVVAADAVVDASAGIGPGVVVGARCRVGPRSELHANCVLYEDVSVGADSVLRAGVVVREGCAIGDRVVIDPGAVIGNEGFGFTFDDAGHPLRIAQVGRVVVEDEVEIGANTTIQRATLDETRIGRGSKIDGLVVVSHNCELGEDVLMVGLTGLGGSTVLEDHVVMMGQTATRGHQRIGAGSFVGARGAVNGDLAPGSRAWGTPAVEERLWHKQVAAMKRLPDLLRRMRRVERQLHLANDAAGNVGSSPTPPPSDPGGSSGSTGGES